MPTPLLVQAMRLPFLTGSLVPVLVVAAWWWGQGSMPWDLLLLTLAGVGCLQSGANLINDFYDALGSDPINRHATIFSGGSRVIQDGRMSRRGVGVLAVGFFVAAGACGGMVAAMDRPWALFVGAAGLAGGWLYSAGPLALMSLGLGEACIFILFGPLLTWGVGYVLSGELWAVAWWLGLPQAWQIAAVLWINQFPDMAADAAAAKNNLVVRLGLAKSRVVYAAIMLAPFPSLALAGARLGPHPLALFGPGRCGSYRAGGGHRLEKLRRPRRPGAGPSADHSHPPEHRFADDLGVAD